MREESDKQGFSVNAITNRILQEYCEHGRWRDRVGAVFLTRSTLARIIGCCPDDGIEAIAKTSGSTATMDMLRTIGINPTYNELKHFIEDNLGKSANWFNYYQYTKGKKKSFICDMS